MIRVTTPTIQQCLFNLSVMPLPPPVVVVLLLRVLL